MQPNELRYIKKSQYLIFHFEDYEKWISLYYYFTPCKFFTRVLTGRFHWSLSDRKFPQVSKILLSIIADFNSAMVWIVSNPSLYLPQFLFHTFAWDTIIPTYSWNHRHLHVL